MEKTKDRKVVRRRIRHRIRTKFRGNATKPRLAVYRSLNHIYVQAVDDGAGITIAAAGSHEKGLGLASGGNVAAAKQVGERIASLLKEKGIETVVFDRGGFRYHGRVKALAEAARAAGINF